MYALITFYEENKIMWSGDTSSSKNKAQRYAAKLKLPCLFDGKYSIEALETPFHTLRTAMKREVRKRGEQDQTPKKKWKFYDTLLLITEEEERIKTSKRITFDTDEREILFFFLIFFNKFSTYSNIKLQT